MTGLAAGRQLFRHLWHLCVCLPHRTFSYIWSPLNIHVTLSFGSVIVPVISYIYLYSHWYVSLYGRLCIISCLIYQTDQTKNLHCMAQMATCIINHSFWFHNRIYIINHLNFIRSCSSLHIYRLCFHSNLFKQTFTIYSLLQTFDSTGFHLQQEIVISHSNSGMHYPGHLGL